MDSLPSQWDEWNQLHHSLAHNERMPVMYAMVFEPSVSQVGSEGMPLYSRMALSLNVSSAGLCVLMNHTPTIGDVWRVRIPSSTVGVRIPTLADVRWVRSVPFSDSSLVVVGLKFLL